MASDGSQCRIIMRDGVLLPEMTLPVLGPPPPNLVFQRLREAWCLKIIDWEGVFGLGRPMAPVRRVLADHWREPNAARAVATALGEDDE